MATLAAALAPKRIWASWGGERARRWSTRAVVAAAALLVLDSTATIDIGFTVNPSYLLAALACAVGAPLIRRGYLALAPVLRWSAAALLATYALSLLLGDPLELAGYTRASGARGIAYLADLTLGLSIVGLIAGLFENRRLEPLLLAFAVGASIAGAYGVYQWFALRYGLPLGNINTTLDSNGLEGSSQGAGLLGGERVRGTFLEPHFFAAYLGSMLPLTVFSALRADGRSAKGLWAGVVAIVVALGLTISGPGWAIVALVVPVVALLYVIGSGWAAPAALVATITLTVWVSVVPVLTSPQVLAPILGRPSADLSYSTAYRTGTWETAVDLWTHRPVLGAGPGQAAPRLTRSGVPGLGTVNGTVLLSAQGIWAAALLDGGVVGLCLWATLFAALLFLAGRVLARAPTLVAAAVLASGAIVVAQVLVSADRLFPRQWLVLGVLAAAAAGSAAGQQRGKGHQASEG